MTVEQRLADLGIELPEVPAPVAAYVPAVRTGNMIYTSGQLPFAGGALLHTGLVGTDVERATTRSPAPASAHSTRWPRSLLRTVAWRTSAS